MGSSRASRRDIWETSFPHFRGLGRGLRRVEKRIYASRPQFIRNLSAGRKPDVYSDYLIHLSFDQTSFFLRGNYTACTRMMDRVRVAATGLENTAEKFVQERKGGIKVKVSG